MMVMVMQVLLILSPSKKIDGYQATIKEWNWFKTTNSGLNVNFGKEKWGFSINGGSWGSGFSKRKDLTISKELIGIMEILIF